jgi:hypothetical protein
VKRHPELEWMTDAVCPDGLDIFFEPELERLAKELFCAECPVAWECFRYGVRVDHEWGVFGGTTPMERLALLHQLRYRLPIEQPAVHREHVAALRQKELQPC